MCHSMTSVTEFIQLVERYPCLYNSDVPDYARKDTTEKAWQEVANELDWTVMECKDKWKNIRNGYVRSLKPSPNGVPKKPYYLCDVLQFILPYINPATNIQIDKRVTKNPIEETYVPSEDEEKKEDEIDDEIEIEIRPPTVQRTKPNVLKRKASTDVDKALLKWLQNKKPKDLDPRKMFLLSLLPDVKKLTDEQLGVFRIKTLMMLEEVKTQSGKSLQRLLERNK